MKCRATPKASADDEELDFEAAMKQRVVRVTFTMLKLKLRVISTNPDGSSTLTLPKDKFRRRSSSSERLF
jgi:hypothetical protein